MMRLFTSLAVVLVSCATSAVAFPLSEIQMGSKHTLYLATCTTRSLLPGCPLVIICPRASDSDSSNSKAAAQTYNAVAYYESRAYTNDNPTEMVSVRERGAPWEGARSSAIMRNSYFYSDVDKNARKLTKGSIAGSAKVGSEDFACFRDGDTEFDVRSNGIIGSSTSHCMAEYWCASVDV